MNGSVRDQCYLGAHQSPLLKGRIEITLVHCLARGEEGRIQTLDMSAQDSQDGGTSPSMKSAQPSCLPDVPLL